MSINERDTKSLYVIKLVQPKDLRSIVYPNTWCYSWKVLALGKKVLALVMQVLAIGIIHSQKCGTH